MIVCMVVVRNVKHGSYGCLYTLRVHLLGVLLVGLLIFGNSRSTIPHDSGPNAFIKGVAGAHLDF